MVVKVIMAKTEHDRITRAAGVTGLFTLLSRILGLVRDQVVAFLFGAGTGADAFFVAFRIPNLLRRLSSEGAMSGAFVPVYTQVLTQSGPGEARRVAGASLTVLAAILAGLTVLGIVFAPLLVRLIAPGFAEDPDKLRLTIDLTRIVFPYIFSISLATLLMSQLQSHGFFAAPAAAPVALNVAIISLAVLLGPRLDRPATALALGAVIGGVLQLLLQVPQLVKKGIFPLFIWQPGMAAVRTMGRRMVPVIFGAAVYQVNLLVNTLLASFLPEGSVSFLYYADRLVQFPLGVFGMALGTAILPSLSRQAAQGDQAGLAQTTAQGFRLSLFILLPSSLGLALLAGPIVELIYQRGEFTSLVSGRTVQALWAYAPGLVPASLATVGVRLFNALGDTKTPALVGAATVAANIALSLALMGPLAHAGLALASSLAAGLNLLLLLLLIRRKAGYIRVGGLFAGLGKTLAAALGMALFLGAGFFWPGSPAGRSAAYLQVGLGVGGGVVVYFGLARLLKDRALTELLGALTHRKGGSGAEKEG